MWSAPNLASSALAADCCPGRKEQLVTGARRLLAGIACWRCRFRGGLTSESSYRACRCAAQVIDAATGAVILSAKTTTDNGTTQQYQVGTQTRTEVVRFRT